MLEPGAWSLSIPPPGRAIVGVVQTGQAGRSVKRHVLAASAPCGSALMISRKTTRTVQRAQGSGFRRPSGPGSSHRAHATHKRPETQGDRGVLYRTSTPRPLPLTTMPRKTILPPHLLQWLHRCRGYRLPCNPAASLPACSSTGPVQAVLCLVHTSPLSTVPTTLCLACSTHTLMVLSLYLTFSGGSFSPSSCRYLPLRHGPGVYHLYMCKTKP